MTRSSTRSESGLRRFFEYARARHEITLRRAAGLPREQWTDDPILQRYRFTCVFRERDKTTTWFRRMVRDPMRDAPEVLLATVVFRMLNRIESGEAMFCQLDINRETGFQRFARTGDVRELRRELKLLLPRGPWVTGAYIITSPPGLSKLDGMMQILRNFHRDSEWLGVAQSMTSGRRCGEPWYLQAAHEWLREQPYFGNFHSYEIVTDLRWTSLLDCAPDVMTWASVGPGARRGLNRVSGRDKRDKSLSAEDMLTEMRHILRRSRDADCWPQPAGDGEHVTFTTKRKRGLTVFTRAEDWSHWEMRDVEHTLCEFDKYERVRLEEGKPRGVYR